MYLGSRPRRRSPRVTVILLLLILIATLAVHYIATYQPTWSQAFETTPTPTRSAQSYTAEAEAYIHLGQLDEAIAAYQRAVAVAPGDAMGYKRLAELFIWRERTVEALYHARQAVILEPSNAQTVAILCRALDWEAEYADALQACECALELDPKYAEGYAYLSEVDADVGNWSAARKNAQQAIDLNFQSMDAHRNLGYVLELQGRYKQAAQEYENAVFLQPRLAALYIGLGRTYRSLNKFTDAIDRLEHATRLEPANPVGYDQLGWTYYTAGQYSKAVDALERATQVDAEYTAAWGHLGLVNYLTQQYEKAIIDLERSIKLAEKDHMERVRRVVIVQPVAGGQDEVQPGVELLSGEFTPLDRRGATGLTATLTIAAPAAKVTPESGGTCGDTIASGLGRLVSSDVYTSEAALSGSGAPPPAGVATLDLNSGRLEVRLTGLPQPGGTPYEAQLKMWPAKTISLGPVQPDAQGNAAVEYTFDFNQLHPAPIETYYALGFSYIHLDQCDKGVPWLLKSLDIDSGQGNPAWQGLADCPQSQIPTPVPE